MLLVATIWTVVRRSPNGNGRHARRIGCHFGLHIANLMSNTAGGATWVSFHHGGGVGMGYSQHAGMVVVADGTERAVKCLRRVLFNDPGWEFTDMQMQGMK